MPEAVNFKLGAFDGPLDLLIALISKHKIDIYDIPIALILEQYLDYLDDMNHSNIELSSEFVVMACELLYIKSKLLLPAEEAPEEDPRTELVETLLEYSRVKAAAEYLRTLEEKFYKRYYPTPQPFFYQTETTEYDKSFLPSSFRTLKIALKAERETKKKQSVENLFSVKQVSIEQKIIFVLRHLVKAIRNGSSVSFMSLFDNSPSKRDAVATFLAMIELVSTGRISYKKYSGDYIICLNTEKGGNTADVS
ncbi:MAG: segregation/condensation protein A [Oscillospiraceae bacterium]|nr:segregation/condensation protein A [Oscillospiraceae bacterium]